MNTDMTYLEEVLDSHSELIKIDKSTYEFGFKWNFNDGIVLYPENTIATYLKGLINFLFPEINVVVFKRESFANSKKNAKCSDSSL